MFLKFGAPLSKNGVRYTDVLDRITEQEAEVKNFIIELEELYQKQYEEDPSGFRMHLVCDIFF